MTARRGEGSAAMVEAGPTRDKFETRAAVAIIVIAAGLRVLVAATMGLRYDETYDVVVARHFALSYYDHPPAIMWLIHAIVAATGSENPLIVRLPTLLLFTAQNAFLYALTRRVFDARAALFAVLAISLTPLFVFFVGTLALTDGPLIFALTAAAYFLVAALERGGAASWRAWSLAGLFFGLALLSKFSAVLLLPGLAAFLLARPERRAVLKTPGPYAATLVSLVVFSPALIWNFQHGFVAFAFQGERADLLGQVHVLRTARVLAATALVMSVPVWLGQVAALAQAIFAKEADWRRALLVCLSVAPLAFFLLVDLFGRSQTAPHWPAPGYLFTFPLLGAAAAKWTLRRPRLVGGAVAAQFGFTFIAVVGLVVHFYTGWIGRFMPSQDGYEVGYDPLSAEVADWGNLPATLAARGLLDRSRYFLVSSRYFFCFKAKLALGDRLPVVCLDDTPIRGALATGAAVSVGRDAIILESSWRPTGSLPNFLAKFVSVEPLAPVWLVDHGRSVARIELALGRGADPSVFRAAAVAR